MVCHLKMDTPLFILLLKNEKVFKYKFGCHAFRWSPVIM